MEIIHVWMDDPVSCSATLQGDKFKDAKKVEFVFKEEGKEVGRAEATLDARSGKAEGKWEKAKGPDKPLAVRKLSYHVEIDGKPLTNLPEEIHVWAKELEVVAKGKDDKPLAGALARISQTHAEKSGQHHAVERKTDKDGKIVWRLALPGEVKVEWEPPFFLLDKKWIKNSGIVWEAKVEKVAPVALQWPPEGCRHRQWVNLDSDDLQPHHGPTVKVKVVAGKDGPVEKGKKIHLKAVYGGDNSARTPMAGAKKAGETLEMSRDPDEHGGATFEVPVGQAGGDTVLIKVGSTEECLDASTAIETWRRLQYELMAPECMKPRLEENTVGGKKLWDLNKVTRDWAKQRLAAVHVEYDLKEGGSHLFGDDQVASFLHDGAFLGLPGGTYYVLGAPAYKDQNPVNFGPVEKHTVFVRCCDVSASGNPAALAEQTLTQAEETFAVPGTLFKIDPGTGAASVANVRWKAVIPAGTAATHRAFDVRGAPRTGTATIELLTRKRYKIVLDADGASLAGAFDARHCPVKVTWKWILAKLINGSAGDGKQLMNLCRPAKAVACTICHELGHTMGMTVLAGGKFKRDPPEGLAVPAAVPGGFYYDEHGHKGAHCAHGLSDDERQLDAFKGLHGTCIMFGSGGDEEDPRRDAYCPTCTKYLKARNLSDIKSSFKGRAAGEADGSEGDDDSEVTDA